MMKTRGKKLIKILLASAELKRNGCSSWIKLSSSTISRSMESTLDKLWLPLKKMTLEYIQYSPAF
jgi:hypothetical protein